MNKKRNHFITAAQAPLLLGAIFFSGPLAARILIPVGPTEVYEVPRSQIQTYIQRETIEQNLRPVRPARPGTLSDEELLAVPERYLPEDLKKKQAELRKKQESKTAQKKARPKAAPISDVVEVSIGEGKTRNLRLEEAILVPREEEKEAKAPRVLAPQRRLPKVELIKSVEIQGSERVEIILEPGESLEIIRSLGGRSNQENPHKAPLAKAVEFYEQKDYATAVTLAFGVLVAPKISEQTKMWARFLAGHALFQAGFYASSLTQMLELIESPLRNSAVGIAAKAITLTRDDATANQILSKLSLAQIREADQPLFAFHLGRVLLNTGAGAAALSSFSKVPQGHTRFPEAQYYMGVIRASELSSSGFEPGEWERESSMVSQTRRHFEQSRVMARTEEALDLRDLANMALARLAYQAQQYNQAVFYYQQLHPSSPFVRESLFEMAWSLYRLGEFNRSLGMLHALGSPYYVKEDLSELWILRSLNYLKLCRFDEAQQTSRVFEREQSRVVSDISQVRRSLQSLKITQRSDIEKMPAADWLKEMLTNDPVVRKDFTRMELLSRERSRLLSLGENQRVLDEELRFSVQEALRDQLASRIVRVSEALNPYIGGRLNDIQQEYQSQTSRLDVLRYEIYSQAARFPDALARPEATRLMSGSTSYLPGVFLRGHEILWRYNGEFWHDELRGYDYFIPTECLSDRRTAALSNN